MEPQINLKVIKELCLLVLSNSGLDVAELMSLTMTGRVKMHSGEVRDITADLQVGGCLVEEQHPTRGSPQTAAPAAPVQVPDSEDSAEQHAHQQQQQQQNPGQEPQHDRAPAAGSNDSVPGNPAHAAIQPAAAAGSDGTGDGVGNGVGNGLPSATQPAAAAAAAAATAPVQPRTFKRKAVNVQPRGRDQTLYNNAKRAQRHSQVPAHLLAEDESRDAVAAAVSAPVLAGNTGHDVSALDSSKYGKADSQQTSSTTAEAVMSPEHAEHALPAVTSAARAATVSAFGPVKAKQSSKKARAVQQAHQHPHKKHRQLSAMLGATTVRPSTEAAAAWPPAQATAAAAARQQTHHATNMYKCAFKTLRDTKRRSKEAPQRYLLHIKTPNMTNFRFIKVATGPVCSTIEAECAEATCWDDIYQILREYCTHEKCQKLAKLHAENVE